MEEVGVEAEIIAFNRHLEAIIREGTGCARISSSPRPWPADPRGTALERRSRRRRVDRSRRRLTLAFDAAARGSAMSAARIASQSIGPPR
jgi:hypothetical protein